MFGDKQSWSSVGFWAYVRQYHITLCLVIISKVAAVCALTDNQ